MRYAITILALILLPASVPGQRVIGRALESGSDRPIGNVELRLENAGGIVARAVTDSLGRFTLRANGPGVYSVSASHISYATARAPVELAATDQLDVILRLTIAPTEVSPLVVVARGRAPDPYLERNGFYERKADGFGVFKTPEDIEKRRAMTSSDHFQGINGVRLVYGGIQGRDIIITRAEDPNCPPRVIIDNVIVRRGGKFSRPGEQPIDQLIHPQDINAIEIFRSPSEIPRQYASQEVTCGLVLFWTKRGTR
jgi:hypothetical protein